MVIFGSYLDTHEKREGYGIDASGVRRINCLLHSINVSIPMQQSMYFLILSSKFGVKYSLQISSFVFFMAKCPLSYRCICIAVSHKNRKMQYFSTCVFSLKAELLHNNSSDFYDRWLILSGSYWLSLCNLT